MSKFEDYEINDSVSILRSSIDSVSTSDHSLFYNTTIVAKQLFNGQYSYKVKLPGAAWSKWIKKQKIFKSIGILILQIGDLETESRLLDPLFNSVNSFFRMLLTDDQIESFKIRTQTELALVWKKYEKKFSHVIIIGHGEKDAIFFSGGKKITADKLANLLDKNSSKDSQKKIFFSLCCHTGSKDFGGKFSKFPVCKQFIGPTEAIYGPYALLFCELFFIQSMQVHDSRLKALNETNKIEFLNKYEAWINGIRSHKFAR
jgi:hypothetical protein